jgi:hypothetical protein
LQINQQTIAGKVVARKAALTGGLPLAGWLAASCAGERSCPNPTKVCQILADKVAFGFDNSNGSMQPLVRSPFEILKGAVMSANPSHTPEHLMIVGDTRLALSESIQAPVVYFEVTPTAGHLNGVIEVCLATTRHLPDETGKLVRTAFVSGYLKCNIPAARDLIESLKSALLLAQPVENPEGKAN